MWIGVTNPLYGSVPVLGEFAEAITLANYGIGDRDCADFDFRVSIPDHYDPHGLDGDDDGVGYEVLPAEPFDDFDEPPRGRFDP